MNRDLNLARWPGNMVWVRRISAEEGKGSLERGRGGALTSEPPLTPLAFMQHVTIYMWHSRFPALFFLSLVCLEN
jgi:hypothetical protein